MPHHLNNKYPVKFKKYQMVLLMKCFNTNSSNEKSYIHTPFYPFIILLIRTVKKVLKNVFLFFVYYFS